VPATPTKLKKIDPVPNTIGGRNNNNNSSNTTETMNTTNTSNTSDTISIENDFIEPNIPPPALIESKNTRPPPSQGQQYVPKRSFSMGPSKLNELSNESMGEGTSPEEAIIEGDLNDSIPGVSGGKKLVNEEEEERKVSMVVDVVKEEKESMVVKEKMSIEDNKLKESNQSMIFGRESFVNKTVSSRGLSELKKSKGGKDKIEKEKDKKEKEKR